MTMPSTKRLAMWSGPRNISTALMRSFENRPDCCVVDEPFYAYYLHKTGLDHPGRKEVLASQPTDAVSVIRSLNQPLAPGFSLQYEKHMAHHFLPGMPSDWFVGRHHCILLRDPRAVIASYIKTRPTVTLEDIGVLQLQGLFKKITQEQGEAPLVVDSDDLLRNPAGMLEVICNHIGIEFLPSMLCWPAGKRDSDGVWAPWWYASVEASTGFEARLPFTGELNAKWQNIAEQAADVHEQLSLHKIQI